ncbi:MAG TPA: peptide ABC transporter substrate-binding protein, partial [Gemmatimonadaceae bacterium]
VIIASGADAEAVLPPLVYTTVGKMITDLLYEPLADINDSLNAIGDRGFTPRLAKSWSWAADSQSIAFHIDPAAKWQDGRPVRAQDVKFSHELFVDPVVHSISASNLSNVDSITTPDSSTAVVWFNRRLPEQFFDFVYNLRVLPEHRLGSVPRDKLGESSEASQPVGSGPFRFVRWERSSLLELEADTANWRQRPLLDRIILSVSPDPTAATTQVLAGNADFIEVLRGDAIQSIQNNPNAVAVNFPGYDYGAVCWNLRDPTNEQRPHPILGDRNLRRALAMGVDRATVVKSVLDTLGVVSQGPYVRAQAFVDPTLVAYSYDQAAAKAILDSLGWKINPRDSIRARNGQRLSLTLLVPTSSSTRLQTSVILQDQFKQIGAELKIEKLESTALGERVFGTRKWDAAFIGWHPDPGSSAVAQNWSSSTAIPGGPNITRYVSREFDAHLDSARTTYDPAAARVHFRQAFTVLNNDAPAIWIYELRSAAGINKRIRPAPLRPDAWWAHLDRWSIAEGQRIARDNIGLGK